MRDRYYFHGNVLRCRFCGFRLHAAPDQPRCEPGVTCPAEPGSAATLDPIAPGLRMAAGLSILAALGILCVGLLAGCTRDSYRSDPTWAGVKQVENP